MNKKRTMTRYPLCLLVLLALTLPCSSVAAQDFDPPSDPALVDTADTLPASEPEILLGDCDLDGEVDFADVPAFVDVLVSRSFLAEADADQDGDVDFRDIFPFVGILIAEITRN